jgi:hypothetical protein
VGIGAASPVAGCTGAEPATANSQVEPTAAVDPGDPSVVVSAWQQDRNRRGGALGIVAARSDNGGSSWTSSRVAGLTRCGGGSFALVSDPVLSFGPGRLYLATVGITGAAAGNAILVGTSTDDGATWGRPVPVRTADDPRLFLDKPTVLADRRLPGSAWVAWLEYRVTDPRQLPRADSLFVSRTVDGGRSWSAPARVYGADTESQFQQLLEMRDGSLLDVFVEGTALAGRQAPARIALARSTDGGHTWSRPVTAARFTYTVVKDPTGRSGVRATGQSISAAAGPDGSVYVAWTEDVLPRPSSLSVARSPDGGATWDGPVAVIRAMGQPFIPTLATDPQGRIGLLWYQFRTGAPSGRLDTDVWFGWSSDGGAEWHPLRLAGPFDLHTAPLTQEGDFLGDYEALVGLPAGFAAVYAQARPQSRTGPTEVFFSRLQATGR